MSCKKFLLIICLIIFIQYGSMSKIIGGELAKEKEFPYAAVLEIVNRGFWGGVIVSRKQVLTNCVSARNLIAPYQDATVRTGSIDYIKMVYHGISRVTLHPKFSKRFPNATRYDVAVITLCTPIDFNEYQRPVKLPRKAVRDGLQAVVIGWGSLKAHDQHFERVLRKLDVTVHSVEVCSREDGKFDDRSQICTVDTGGRGACIADHGGPLVDKGVLIGIVSSTQCDRGRKDIFVNIHECLDFIRREIDPLICMHPFYATTVMTKIVDGD